MQSGRQATFGPVFRRRLVAPAVDDQRSIEPDAHTIIGARDEAPRAGGEVVAANPAYGEVVAAKAIARPTAAPVKVDAPVAAGEGRAAGEAAVIEVLAAKLAVGATAADIQSQRVGAAGICPVAAGDDPIAACLRQGRAVDERVQVAAAIVVAGHFRAVGRVQDQVTVQPTVVLVHAQRRLLALHGIERVGVGIVGGIDRPVQRLAAADGAVVIGITRIAVPQGLPGVEQRVTRRAATRAPGIQGCPNRLAVKCLQLEHAPNGVVVAQVQGIGGCAHAHILALIMLNVRVIKVANLFHSQCRCQRVPTRRGVFVWLPRLQRIDGEIVKRHIVQPLHDLDEEVAIDIPAGDAARRWAGRGRIGGEWDRLGRRPAWNRPGNRVAQHRAMLCLLGHGDGRRQRPARVAGIDLERPIAGGVRPGIDRRAIHDQRKVERRARRGRDKRNLVEDRRRTVPGRRSFCQSVGQGTIGDLAHGRLVGHPGEAKAAIDRVEADVMYCAHCRGRGRVMGGNNALERGRDNDWRRILGLRGRPTARKCCHAEQPECGRDGAPHESIHPIPIRVHAHPPARAANQGWGGPKPWSGNHTPAHPRVRHHGRYCAV